MSHNGWSNAYNWKGSIRPLFTDPVTIKVYQLAIDYAVKGIATIMETETASLVKLK